MLEEDLNLSQSTTLYSLADSWYYSTDRTKLFSDKEREEGKGRGDKREK
jgi:hypothetical protein